MKKLLFALAVFALVFPTARTTKAADVSIDFFYNHLGDEGSWIDVGDYGYCWQPGVAASNRNWRPYTDGYWAYTDVGWTWVSYENFGWATYHYGRWARLSDYGWVWVPGTEWGPAWVSWRTGGDHIGWAPLPPRYSGGRGEAVYEGRPITGRVDVEFDIGPDYYNFVDVRYIGEPVLRSHIYESSRNIAFVTQTVNVTNITYNNNTVYNYGPDYNQLSAYSTRPIQRLRIEREANFNPANFQAGALTKVQGDRLMVAAPLRFERAAEASAPKVVKAKVERANLEHGWMGIADPQAKAKLQEKMKTEDLKAVPPPQMQPAHPAALAGEKDANQPGSQPIVGSSPPPADASPGASLIENGKGKNKRGAPDPQVTTNPPNAALNGEAQPSPAATPLRGKGFDKRTRLDEAQTGGDPLRNAAPESVSPEKWQRGNGKNMDKRGNAAPQAAPAALDTSAEPPTANVPAAGAQSAAPVEGKHDRKIEKREGRKQPAAPVQAAPTAQGAIAAPAEANIPAAGAQGNAPIAPQRDGKQDRKNEKREGRREPAAAPLQSAPQIEAVPQNVPPPPRGDDQQMRAPRGGPRQQIMPQVAPTGGQPEAATQPPQPQPQPQPRGKGKAVKEEKEKKGEEQPPQPQ